MEKLNCPQISFLSIKTKEDLWKRRSREKVSEFANHVQNVLSDVPITHYLDESDNNIYEFVNSSYQLKLPYKNFTVVQVINRITTRLNPTPLSSLMVSISNYLNTQSRQTTGRGYVLQVYKSVTDNIITVRKINYCAVTSHLEKDRLIMKDQFVFR